MNDTQTIKAGYVLVLNTAKASVAADAATAGTVLGVSATTITTTTATPADVVKVDVNPMSIYSAPFSGTATPAVGTAYDMGANAGTFDADDSVGGFIQVIGNVDTTAGRADVVLVGRVYTGNAA